MFLQKATPQKVFMIKKVKHTVSWTYVIWDANGEEIFETFNNKLYVQWKGDGN